MVIWVTFFINIGFLIYYCFGRAIELLGDFVLWIYGWVFLFWGFCLPVYWGYGIGSSWILWKKVIYKYIKNTNKKIIPVLERNLGMGFDSLGRVINRYVRVMIR